MSLWKDVKTYYRAGEKLKAKELFYDASKIKMLRAVGEALDSHRHTRGQEQDLTTLREILKNICGYSSPNMELF
jgi:hypothetical protein